MKILIIKLSSMGDIVHTFPAIIDAKNSIKNLVIDWLVDEQFLELVKLQDSLINKIISIPLRSTLRSNGRSNKGNFFIGVMNIIDLITKFFPVLREQQYDLVIDPQGLLKSAIIAKFIKTTKIIGFDRSSAREPLASIFYHQKIYVDRNLHAIYRTKKLFSQALGYDLPTAIQYNLINNGIKMFDYFNSNKINNYVVFLHGTTWESKTWQVKYWQSLSKLLNDRGITVVVMACNQQELQFTERLLEFNRKIIVLNKLAINQVVEVLAHANVVITVDTGLGHLSAALGVNVIGLYGATSQARSGILGDKCINIQSNYHCSPCLARECLEYKHNKSTIKQPCFLQITPEIVMSKISKII